LSKLLFLDGFHRASVHAGTTLDALFGNGVFVVSFDDSVNRAGIGTGTTGSAVISYYVRHFENLPLSNYLNIIFFKLSKTQVILPEKAGKSNRYCHVN